MTPKSSWLAATMLLLPHAGCRVSHCEPPDRMIGEYCAVPCMAGFCSEDGAALGHDAADVADGMACGPGTIACNDACVNAQSDRYDCGACGTICGATAHATPGCSAGRCTNVCDAGFADCDGDLANGCEVDLATDIAHCGTCATGCAGAEHASATCSAGVCGLTCAGGYADCDMNSANGCEVSTRENIDQCGACGNRCPDLGGHSQPACHAGQCGIECVNPEAVLWEAWIDCDGASDNGCETNLRANATCGQRCGYGPCPAGSDCDGGDCCDSMGAGCLRRP